MIYPPPMAYPVPQPPPRRNHTLRTVLIIVGVVGVLCLGGLVAGGFTLYKVIDNATRPERDATKMFLKDLEAGNTTAAYDYLCAAVRQKYSQDEFAQYVDGQRKIARYQVYGFNVNTTDGVTTGNVDARLYFDDDSSENHEFDLVKESGAWRVCGDPY